jgi:N-acetyl-gamma-glutamyl-phosphate reductase
LTNQHNLLYLTGCARASSGTKRRHAQLGPALPVGLASPGYRLFDGGIIVVISISIIGGTGYTGGELLRIAAQHPEFELTCVTSRANAGSPVADAWPQFRGRLDLDFSAPDPARLADSDLVFCATPNGTAMGMVPDLVARGVKVVDLSADFRLKSAGEWEKWYGRPHACPELLDTAVYGLPELSRDVIRTARLVANPGCYPTAIILGVLPLLQRGIIDPRDIIADAKSGVSGAGRGASVDNLFGEVSGNFRAYGVSGHRHHPEIAQALSGLTDVPIGFTFVPHLLPMFRGMQATIYADVLDREIDAEGALAAYYADHPFVAVEKSGGCPATKDVLGTNLCRIAVHSALDGARLIILSVIDNLTKGAAGQAVQNANLMCGLDEDTGLNAIALRP